MKIRKLTSNSICGAIWLNDLGIEASGPDISTILSNLNLKVGSGLVRI